MTPRVDRQGHKEVFCIYAIERNARLVAGSDSPGYLSSFGVTVHSVLPPSDQLHTNRDALMDQYFDAAVAEARLGLTEGGIPIGSVVVHKGKIIGRGHNRRIQQGSAILHGEMDALENAGRLSAAVYAESVLYTTLSPCAMCSGAILLYGIPRVVVGENMTFRGEEELLRERGVFVEVLQDQRCFEMMRRFIQEHPALWNEDIGA
jgi:cytosine deaminase